MSYTQLTQDQRYQIYALKQVEQTNKRIAEILGVHASTVSRELKRNRGKKGYRPKQADQKANWERNLGVCRAKGQKRMGSRARFWAVKKSSRDDNQS